MIETSLLNRINQQIAFELDSAHIYLAMAIHFDTNGWSGFANWMYHQCDEEREHAKMMIDYVVSRGEKPTLTLPAFTGAAYDGVIPVFEAAYAHECKVSKSINEIVSHAIENKDYATENFFRKFVDEQVEEEENVAAIIDKLKLAGSNSGFLVVDGQLATRK